MRNVDVEQRAKIRAFLTRILDYSSRRRLAARRLVALSDRVYHKVYQDDPHHWITLRANDVWKQYQNVL